MAVVVSDTSPVRALSFLRRMDVLPVLFGEVLIPPAVVQELAKPAGAFAPLDVRTLPELRVASPTNFSRVSLFRKTLDPGESEALALALEIGAQAILMDETAGRVIAKRAGLNPIGVIGILTLAKSQKLIVEVKPLLDRLINESNFFVSADLRTRALRQAGEQP